MVANDFTNIMGKTWLNQKIDRENHAALHENMGDGFDFNRWSKKLLLLKGINTVRVKEVFDSNEKLLGVNIKPSRKLHHKFDILIIDTLFEESTIRDFVIEEETFFPISDMKAFIINPTGDSYLKVVYDSLTLDFIKFNL